MRHGLFAVLILPVLAAAPSLAQAAKVGPFSASPDYLTPGKPIFGAKTGPHRAAFTSRFASEPVYMSRPLSVRPDTSLNGELARDHGARLGARALPPVFGGFTTIVYNMKAPTSFTTRAQFHSGESGRNDFLNFHVYVESDQPQPPGLEFGFTGAFLFHAGDAGAPGVVSLEKIATASFFTASQRQFARISRLLVRDADGGDFYVSESFTTENSASISVKGGKWAKIDPANLTILGDYRPATFQRVDHIGLYSTIPVTESNEVLPAFGVICNVALHWFELGLVP